MTGKTTPLRPAHLLLLVAGFLVLPGLVNAQTSTSDNDVFVSLEPCVLFDTRQTTKMAGGETRDFEVVGGDLSAQGGDDAGCGVASEARAVFVNLVAIQPDGGGNLKAWAGDQPEPAGGGVVNYQQLDPTLNNANGVVLPIRADTSAGPDLTIKANGSGTHLRGVALGYLVAAVDHFYALGSTVADSDLLDGRDSTDFASLDHQDDDFYCALHEADPESYPAGPCRAPSYTALVTTVERFDGDDEGVGGNTSLAIGADGLPVVSHSFLELVDFSLEVELRVTHCGDATCRSWTTTVLAEARTNSLAIGDDGLPIVSYEVGSLWLAFCKNVACTQAASVTLDSADSVGSFSSIAIGADGLPVVSYYDSANDDLKVAHCGNAACSTDNTLTPVDEVGDVGEWTSLAIGTDGLPVISYYDVTNGDLKVAHCGDAACTSGNTLTTVDSEGDVGLYGSIAIGADGLPVISYVDETNDHLKVAHCGDAACSSGTTISVIDAVIESFGAYDTYTSIELGIDGLPVVSYHAAGNDLKVAHCGNGGCTSGNTLTTVDSEGDVGGFPSIAVSAGDVPVVSYYDFTNLDLKVAHLLP